jgi:hypothetical protein
MIRKKIANLKVAMRNEFKGNVRDFDVHVANLRDQLLGRGQRVDELVTHLFDAYIDEVPNDEFKRYIEMHRKMFDDGLNLTSDQLMRHALIKYDTINQRSSTNQDADPPVIALQAAVAHTSDSKKDDNTVLKSLIAKLTEHRKGKKQNRKIPGWKKKEPSAKDPAVKTVNGKTYHWCPRHKLWTIHNPADCTLQAETSSGREVKNTDPTIALSKALLSMMENEQEE